MMKERECLSQPCDAWAVQSAEAFITVARASSIFHKDGRSPVHWSLRERLSRIHEKNSKVDRNTEIEEKPQSLRHFSAG